MFQYFDVKGGEQCSRGTVDTGSTVVRIAYQCAGWRCAGCRYRYGGMVQFVVEYIEHSTGRDCFVDANLRFFSSPLFLFGGEDMDIVLTERQSREE